MMISLRHISGSFIDTFPIKLSFDSVDSGYFNIPLFHFHSSLHKPQVKHKWIPGLRKSCLQIGF